jgi:hypothetical protein
VHRATGMLTFLLCWKLLHLKRSSCLLEHAAAVDVTVEHSTGN